MVSSGMLRRVALVRTDVMRELVDLFPLRYEYHLHIKL
jgi:hypothetical protein